MPPYPNFVGGTYAGQSLQAMNRRVVNYYVEPPETKGGLPAYYPTPGVEVLSTGTSSPGRAHAFISGREFAVIGVNFCEIARSGAITVLGTVAVDRYPATLSWNGDGGGEIFVTSGNNGYIYDLSAGTLTQVRTGGTRMGAHLDGFFLALDADTSTLYISEPLDGTTWDPTQFAQRSIQPDAWIAVKVWDRYIWLFGTETSEVWYNAGTAPFPFQPHPSGLVPYGIAAPFAAHVVGGGLQWLSATSKGWGQVVRARGFTPEVVSSFPVLIGITEAGEAADQAIADGYDDRGHTFYVLTHPGQAVSYAYDTTDAIQLSRADRWTERATWISESNSYVAWRPLYHAFAFGESRILDRDSGAVMRLTPSSHVDVEDRPIRRVIRPPAIGAAERRLYVPEIELNVEPGLALASGQGSNPRVSMSISRDWGKTFGPERARSAGALGEYDKTVRWARNGSVKRGMGFQPEFVVSDPVPWRVTGARLHGAA